MFNSAIQAELTEGGASRRFEGRLGVRVKSNGVAYRICDRGGRGKKNRRGFVYEDRQVAQQMTDLSMRSVIIVIIIVMVVMMHVAFMMSCVARDH